MKPLSIPSYLLEPALSENEIPQDVSVTPDALSQKLRSDLRKTLQKPMIENPHFHEDLHHYMDYALHNPTLQSDPDITPDLLEEEFSYMRPRAVAMLDSMGNLEQEYRCYSLNDIGAGGYKRVQSKLYVAEGAYHVAADASVKNDKVYDFVETLDGEVVSPLRHEMNMYAHLSRLLSVHPEMARYFLKFYGCSHDKETGEMSMSLEMATGFEQESTLAGMLDKIAAMEDFMDLEEHFVDDLMEDVRGQIAYYKQQAFRFFIDAVIAIAFLHENNVFCSDVKPENFFLHTDDSGSYAKLGDFGAAMFIGHDALHLKDTQVTPGYYDLQMIDEIFDGEMDPRQADLFALRRCIDELWESNILSLDIYERIVALPWDDMFEPVYAAHILPALRTLLILQ